MNTYTHLSIYLFIYLSIYLSIYRSIDLSIFLSFLLSFYLSFYSGSIKKSFKLFNLNLENPLKKFTKSIISRKTQVQVYRQTDTSSIKISF